MARIEDGPLGILIVDDQPQTRQMLRAVLRSLGFQRVTEAENVTEAYAAIRRVCPDLVLTDWEMPGGAGIELVRAVRTRSDSPDPLLPIIMITSHGNIDYVTAGRDAGATHFLVKPFSPARLRERIMDVARNERPFIVSPNYRGPCRRRSDRPVANDRRSPATANVLVLPPDGLLLAKIEGNGIALTEAMRRRAGLVRQIMTSAAPATPQQKKELLGDGNAMLLGALIDNALAAATAYTDALARMAEPLAMFGEEHGTVLPPAALKLVASLQRILADPTKARADPKLVELHLQALKAMLRTELGQSGLLIAQELATEIDALARETVA